MNEPAQRHCPPSALATGVGAEHPDVHRLALLFATEPELIPACLEAPESGQPMSPAVILAAAKQAITSRPKHADLRYFAAHAAMHVDELEEARTLLASALELNPQYNAALILAARICVLQGQHGEALQHLRQAVFNGADYADVHTMLGDLWRGREEFARAREAYQRALQINDNLPAVCERLCALDADQQRRGTDELPA